MNCPDARDLFSAWVDAALTPAERAELDAHLAQCPECRREMERFESTLGLLHRAERLRAPAGFVDRVLERARPAPWHRRWLRRVFLPLSVKLPVEAAAVILVAVLALHVVQRTPELEQATRRDIDRGGPYPSPVSPVEKPTRASDLRERAASSEPAPSAIRATQAKPDASPPSEERVASPGEKEAKRGGASASPPAAPAPAATPRAQMAAPPPAAPDRAPVIAAPEPPSSAAPSRPGATSSADGFASPGAVPPPAPGVAVSPPAHPSSMPAAPPAPGAQALSGEAGTSSRGAPSPTARSSAAKKPAEADTLATRRAPEGAAPPPRLDSTRQELADTPRDKSAAAPTPPARVLPRADVAGRLTVRDGATAERELGAALARAGGSVIARRRDPGATIVDLVVPRAAYADFSRALAGIGSWVSEGEPADLPDQVRITLRLVE